MHPDTRAPEPGTPEPPRWDRVVEAHLRILRRVQPVSVLEILSDRARFAIDKVIGNGAASYPDVLRYLDAVREALGPAAWVSAKFVTTSRMRDLGLTSSLPHAGRNWAPAGGPGRRESR